MNNNYDSYDENKYFEFNEEDEEENNSSNNDLYTDGDDKKPKLVLIIVGIILLIIIILITAISCSKLNKKSDNNYLSNIEISNGELDSTFDKNKNYYTVYTTDDYVGVRCILENSKASASGCSRNIYVVDECVENVIKVTAQNKSVREYKLNICKGNKNGLIITGIDINPLEQTTSKVTIKVNVESKNGLAKKGYSFDGGKTWQESNTFTVKENKILYIKVKDVLGNESETIEKEINNIDNSKITVSLKGSIPSGEKTSSNVYLTADVNPSFDDYKYEWYKDNKKISGASNYTYNASSSGNYKVVVITTSGKKATSNVYKVNKVSNNTGGGNSGSNNTYKLEITSVTGNATGWTKQDVTLVVNATASNGIASKGYSFDGGKTYQSSNKKTFSSNQTVNIKVKDKKNNVVSYNAYITKIDKTIPSVTINGSRYVGSKISLSLNPKTAPSGYKYEWKKDNKVLSTSNTYTPSVEGTYKVIVTTGAGNSTVKDFIISNPVVPTAKLSGTVPSGQQTTAYSVTLSVSITNGLGKEYTWYKDGVVYKSCSVSTCEVDISGTYKVKVKTTSGHTIETGPYVVNRKSDLKIVVSGNPTSWTNQNVTLTVAAASTEGRSTISYSFDGGKTYQTSNIKTFSSNQTVKIAVKDKANTPVYQNVTINKIDKTKPYTPYPTIFKSIECYIDGVTSMDKPITDVNKIKSVTKPMYCNLVAAANKFSMGVTDSVDTSGGSGITHKCKGVWLSLEKIIPPKVLVSYGKLPESGFLDEKSSIAKIINLDKITYYEKYLDEIPNWGDDKKAVHITYVKRCYDNAGNLSEPLIINATK